MTRPIRLIRQLLLVPCCIAGPLLQAGAKADACTILTRAEIKAALGQPVGDGKPNTRANALGGLPCEFQVGTSGQFSLLIKGANATETPDRIMAELKKMKIAVTETPGLGDRAFYSSPGYGMVQLNAFKGNQYLIITLLVPGLSEAAQKAAAAKLMRTVLQRL